MIVRMLTLFAPVPYLANRNKSAASPFFSPVGVKIPKLLAAAACALYFLRVSSTRFSFLLSPLPDPFTFPTHSSTVAFLHFLLSERERDYAGLPHETAAKIEHRKRGLSRIECC